MKGGVVVVHGGVTPQSALLRQGTGGSPLVSSPYKGKNIKAESWARKAMMSKTNLNPVQLSFFGGFYEEAEDGG